VTVTDWDDEIVETRPLLGDTVTVTATPQLAIDPAEPGADPVICQGPGQPYQPGAGDLWVQAAGPEACTYAYQARSDVGERPRSRASGVPGIEVLCLPSICRRRGDLCASERDNSTGAAGRRRVGGVADLTEPSSASCRAGRAHRRDRSSPGGGSTRSSTTAAPEPVPRSAR
jgi:hypothetical protein